MVSRKSLHLRFNRQIDSISTNLLDYLTNVDMCDHLAVGCTVYENGHWQTIATARAIRETENPEWAEWAAIVADPYHCNGIGTCLLYFISQVWPFLPFHLDRPQRWCEDAVRRGESRERSCPPLDEEAGREGADASERVSCMHALRGRNVWCFPLPMPEDWVAKEEVRWAIENASRGEGILPAVVREYVASNFHEMSGL